MKKNGFTLIELMVVIVIIGTIAAVAIPKFDKTNSIYTINRYVVSKGFTKIDFSDSLINNKWEYYHNISPRINDTIIAESLMVFITQGKVDTNTTTSDDTNSKLSINPKTLEIHEIPYKELSTDVYMIYNTNKRTTLYIIEELKEKTAKNNYSIIDTLSDGFIIKMEW